MTENPAGLTHEYYVDLVQRLPKTPEDQLTPQESELGHAQFGNNFYTLFLGRLEIQRSDNPEEYRQGRINPISSLKLNTIEECYGKEWLRFQNNNKDLLNQIDETLDELYEYKRLSRYQTDLLVKASGTRDFTQVDSFDSMGIERIGIFIWRKLNPLLKAACSKMKEEGIDPERFFN